MEAIDTCLKEIRTLQTDGRMDMACARLEQELDTRAEDAAMCAVLCTELAQLHMESGDMTKAQPLFQRAMGLRELADTAETCVCRSSPFVNCLS
eukprot:3527266-Pyramimonas_sp.AAC.1